MNKDKIMEAIVTIRKELVPAYSTPEAAAIAMYASMIQRVLVRGVQDNDRDIEKLFYWGKTSLFMDIQNERR